MGEAETQLREGISAAWGVARLATSELLARSAILLGSNAEEDRYAIFARFEEHLTAHAPRLGETEREATRQLRTHAAECNVPDFALEATVESAARTLALHAVWPHLEIDGQRPPELSMPDLAALSLLLRRRHADRMLGSCKYRAFISYRHRTGRAFATQLESALKRYARPLLRSPIKIFRDERILRAGDNLPREIALGLESAQFLVLLASPEAAESVWVRDELWRWCSHHGRANRLLIVLTGGEIAVSDQLIDWSATDALPGELADFLPALPLFVDLRETPSTDWDLHVPEFRDAVNTIAATLADVKPEVMNDTEVLQHRKNLRLRNVAVVSLTISLAAAIIGLIMAGISQTRLDDKITELAISESQVKSANTSLRSGNAQLKKRQRELERERDIALSKSTAYAARDVAEVRLDTALLLARYSYDLAPTREAEHTMRSLLGRPTLVSRFDYVSSTPLAIRRLPDGRLRVITRSAILELQKDVPQVTLPVDMGEPDRIQISPYTPDRFVAWGRSAHLVDAASAAARDVTVPPDPEGRSRRISSVRMLPDGRMVLGTRDGTLFLASQDSQHTRLLFPPRTESNSPLARLGKVFTRMLRFDAIASIAVHPTSGAVAAAQQRNLLVSKTVDGPYEAVEIVNQGRKRLGWLGEIFRLEDPLRQRDFIRQVSLVPGTNVLIASTTSRLVPVLAGAKNIVGRERPFGAGISSVTTSRNEPLVAVGDLRGRVHLIKVEEVDGQPQLSIIKSVSACDSPVNALAFLDAGFVSAHRDGTLVHWKERPTDHLRTECVSGNVGIPCGMSFDPSGNRIIVVNHDSSITTVRLSDGKIVDTHTPSSERGSVNGPGVAFSADRTHMAKETGPNEIHVRRTANPKEAVLYPVERGRSVEGYRYRLNADGSVLAVVTELEQEFGADPVPARLTLVRLKDGEKLYEEDFLGILGHFLPGSDELLIHEQGALRTLPSGFELTRAPLSARLLRLDSTGRYVCWWHNGGISVASLESRSVVVRDLRPTMRLDQGDFGFCLNGAAVYFWSYEGLQLWRPSDGALLGKLPYEHRGYKESIAVSPTGDRMAILSAAPTAYHGRHPGSTRLPRHHWETRTEGLVGPRKELVRPLTCRGYKYHPVECSMGEALTSGK